MIRIFMDIQCLMAEAIADLNYFLDEVRARFNAWECEYCGDTAEFVNFKVVYFDILLLCIILVLLSQTLQLVWEGHGFNFLFKKHKQKLLIFICLLIIKFGLTGFVFLCGPSYLWKMIILGPVWLTIIIYFYTIKKIIDVKRERKKK